MKLVFFITAWLVHVEICHSDVSKSDVESLYDKLSEEMLKSVVHAHAHSLNRQKRDLSHNKLTLDDDSGVYRLKSVKPVAELCYPATQTIFVDVLNVTYAICMSAATSYIPAQLVIGYYKEHTWIPFYQQFVNDSTNAAAFNFKRNLYVLLADRGMETGTNLVRINLDSKSAVFDHRVQSSYPQRVALWEMKMYGKYNLAIANGNKNSLNMSTEVFVYDWKDTYFDKYDSFPAYDVTDIEPFHIHGAAYIAVANFRRSKNDHNIDSEIFRYDMDRNAWTSHQRIRTYGAMDWEFFTLGVSLGKEFFLAVANKGDGDPNVKSMIYKFVGDKFSPFQCLPTIKATSFASLSKDGVFLLAVANENDAVHLYQYDGWRFVRSAVQYTAGAMSNGVIHLKFHSVMRNLENVSILSISNPRHPRYPSVFEIGFQYENALRQWNTESTEWCLKVLNKIESSDIDKATGNFEDVIFIDHANITINGDLVFEQGFEAQNLKTPMLKEITTEEVYDNDLLNKLAKFQTRLDVIQNKLNEIAIVLQNSLKVDGDQIIEGQLKFEDAVFDCRNNCRFESVYTDVLNSERIDNWVNDLVFLDSPQVILGTIMAEEINASSVHVSGFVDGVISQNLVTKSGKHPIEGHKIFHELIVTKDLKVLGLIDGVSISANNVLLTSGHQNVSGKLTFDNITTSWLEASNVNGKNLSAFYNDIVLTDKSYTITGEKTFNHIVVNELTMNPGSLINEVDLVDLWKNALWKDGHKDIHAEITFSDVTFAQNLHVLKGINGIQIPSPRVVDITEPSSIAAHHSFMNSTMSTLEVLGLLNNMPLAENQDGSKVLDIMLKTGNQLITGKKVFHTIHLDSDSYVQGTVDGVDLSEFKASVLRKNASIVSNGTWIFKNMIVKGPLTVGGKVSGVSLKDLYDRALKLTDFEVSEIVFNEPVEIEDLNSKNINDLNVREDFVLTNEDQLITGIKTFDEIVLEADSSINGLVNNKNINFLNEILLKIGNQSIKSKVFNKNIKINDLLVTGKINGVPIAEIATLNGTKIFGSRSLKNVSFAKIEARNVEISGKVNNINVQEMIDDTMTYDDYQNVPGLKNFKGVIHVLENSNLQTEDLNEINLSKLWEDCVFIDFNQDISGRKIFNDNVIFNNLHFDKTIDGVSDWDMRYNWMLKNAPQTVESNVVFENGLTTKDLNTTLINGININDLASDIVRVNEATEVKGPIIFENSVFSNGNVTLTGRIQSVDLSEEAVMRDNIIVTGHKIFSDDLIVESDLTVDGTVDGINIENLCTKTLYTNKAQNISSLIIKGDVTVLEGGTINGNLAGVDLKVLEEISVNIKDSKLKFTGTKNFSNIVFDGPVFLKGKFGNINLKELKENYMSLTKFQEIKGKMNFQNVKFKGTLSAMNFDTYIKEVNDVNVLKIFNSVLRIDGVQNVTAKYYIDEIVFEDDLFVAGLVNGLDIPSGLMRRRHINYIESPKIFQKPMIIYGDLEIEKEKTIQGVPISDWFQKAILKEGKFKIYGHKTFNQLNLNDVRIQGVLNGTKISEKSLLMTYGNQAVTGRKTVIGDIDIEKSLTVNGLINQINLTEFADETLQRDRNNTVTGHKYFNKPLTIVALQAPSVAGVNIKGLEQKLNTTLNYTSMENKLDEIESVVSFMEDSFNRQAVFFQYYELFQEFEISTAYNWLHVVVNGLELLLLSDNSSSVAPCTSIRIFGYDDNEGFIPARQELITTYAVSIRSLSLWNSTYLFVANRNPNAPCSNEHEIGRFTLDIYKWVEESFKKVQTLPVNYVEDMTVFKDESTACIIILEFNASNIYCSSEYDDIFKLHEVLHTTGGRKASVIQAMSQIILVIASEDIYTQRQNHFDGKRYVDIYMRNSGTKFSTPIQSIQSAFVQSVTLINHKDEYSEKVFLLITEGSIPKIFNEPKILIYRYEKSERHPFQKYQEIKDYGIIEWLTLKTGELLFFAVDSQHGLIKIFQYKGVSGFVKIDTIRSVGTTAAHAFVRPDKNDWSHYLALAGPHAVMVQPTQGVDYAKILKSKIKGKS